MSQRIRRALLAWYDRHARDLPWRRTRDPYAIWVSEIMLQQTRVETVVRYYDRFLARFPTAAALAAAREDEVLALWSGLGYYRRARLLHAGARAVVAAHEGRVPRDRGARLALPGIGRYTAGAIGSIAFDLPEPIVDGNVARVLTRLHAIDPPDDARHWIEAERLVRGARPGALNQALMELGATVCTPRAPRCEDCPVARACVARATGRTGELPPPRRRARVKRVELVAVVARDARGATVLSRGEGTLFGGLWNVPSAEGRGAAAARAVLRACGFEARLGPSAAGTIDHVLTHRHLVVEVWHATRARTSRTPQTRLVPAADLATLGISSLTRRILAT